MGLRLIYWSLSYSYSHDAYASNGFLKYTVKDGCQKHGQV